MLVMMVPRSPSDLLGACSIALFPFWHFDAKGGEVVLLGVSVGICKGRAQARFPLYLLYLESLCPFILVLNLFASICYLCGLWTMFLSMAMWDLDFGILYVWDYVIMFGMISISSLNLIIMSLYCANDYIAISCWLQRSANVSCIKLRETSNLYVVHLYSNANYLHAHI